MPSRKSALWRCPECGRRFANKNQWHSCTRMTVADHLGDKTPEAVELYRAFAAAVRECGSVRVHPVKTRISFIARMSFAGAALKKRWIDAAFILHRQLDSPRIDKIETYGSSHVHHVRISSVDDVDAELRGWLRESYRVGCQEDERGTR